MYIFNIGHIRHIPLDHVKYLEQCSKIFDMNKGNESNVVYVDLKYRQKEGTNSNILPCVRGSARVNFKRR